MDGEDLRKLPMSMRKANPQAAAARLTAAISIDPFDTGKIVPDLFRAACGMGLKGLVSKRSDRPYRGER